MFNWLLVQFNFLVTGILYAIIVPAICRDWTLVFVLVIATAAVSLHGAAYRVLLRRQAL